MCILSFPLCEDIAVCIIQSHQLLCTGTFFTNKSEQTGYIRKGTGLKTELRQNVICLYKACKHIPTAPKNEIVFLYEILYRLSTAKLVLLSFISTEYFLILTEWMETCIHFYHFNVIILNVMKL